MDPMTFDPMTFKENKTGTNEYGVSHEGADRTGILAAELRILRVWREVVDFGEPCSGTGEEGWGRKRVSVARVSILDGPFSGRKGP
jgi:hypothetical protein